MRRPLAVALAVAALTCYRLVDTHRLTGMYWEEEAVPLVAAMALSALVVYLWRKP